MPSICTALTGSTPVTLADVQRQLLDGDTLLLEFALGAKASFLWVVSQNDLRTFQLPPNQGRPHETDKMPSSVFCRVFLGQRRGGRRLESMGTVVAATVG
jgi:hypothetical protein